MQEFSLTSLPSSMIGGNPYHPPRVWGSPAIRPYFAHEAGEIIANNIAAPLSQRERFTEHVLPNIEVPRQLTTDRATFHLEHVYVSFHGLFQATLYSLERVDQDHPARSETRLARYTKTFSIPSLLRVPSQIQTTIVSSLPFLPLPLLKIIASYAYEPTLNILNTAADIITAKMRQTGNNRAPGHPFLAIQETLLIA